jgi:hypothetical protein
MKYCRKVKSGMKVLAIVLLSLVTAVCFTSASNAAEWSHGIGTGFFGLNLEGDFGVHTNLAGSILIEDADVDFDDVSNLMESAIGFAGYSTDGTWTIRYAYQSLELEGSRSQSIPSNLVLVAAHSLNASLNFEATGAELTVGYAVLKDPSAVVSVDAGVRYTKHELDASLGISGPSVNSTIRRNIEEDWTDALIGGTVTAPLTQDLVWITTANAGFGGSEGTYTAQTGVTWKFHENWSTTVYGKYSAVEYENGSRGSAGWYFYDVDEFGLGIGIAYNWQ